MTRVLHLVGSGIGGAELQLRTLLSEAVVRSTGFVHEVMLVRDGPLAADFAALVPTLNLGKTRHVDPVFARDLVRAIRSRRPHVMHSWGPTPNVWGPVATRLATPSCAVVMAEVGLDEWKGRLPRAVDRIAYSCADRIVGCAHAVSEAAIERGASRERTRTVYLGVNTGARPSRVMADDGVVLLIARMDYRKGHLDLLQAWPAVLASQPGARLVLAGPAQSTEECALRDRVREMIDASAALSATVTLLDHVNPRPYLDRSTVLVVASTSEGLPNVVLEAMSAGVPVVGTDVGGIGELVTDGVTGWLVPPSQPEQMAKALIDALSDRVESTARGWAGRARVEELTVTRSLDNWERVYQEAIERRATR